jgi:hypothetical protein
MTIEKQLRKKGDFNCMVAHILFKIGLILTLNQISSTIEKARLNLVADDIKFFF